MLYALILAGFVFLFVTFCHFVYERLTSPVEELEPPVRQGMDLYISIFIAVILGVTISGLYPESGLYPDFSLSIYLAWSGGMTILILIFLSLSHIVSFLKRKENPSKNTTSWWFDWGKPLGKKVGMDLVVGVLMAVAFLMLLHKYPFLADPEDASMDFVMRVNQCGKGSVCTFPDKKNIPPPPKIVLLNIDNETHRNKQWGGGEPLFTPRDRLKQLIESAVQDGARLIVVDIFSSQRTSTYGLKTSDGLDYPENKLHPHDQELKNYLAEYEEKHCGSKKCPPIILIRDSFRPTTESGSGYFDVQKLPVFQTRQSFLEEAIKPSSHIQWASSIFLTSRFDGNLRRMWLWQPFCEGNKQKFVPSIELLVASLISNESLSYEKALKKINDIGVSDIDPDFVGKDCSSEHPSYYKPKPLSKPIVLGENFKIKAGELSGGGINQRIMFTMPWENPPQEVQKEVQGQGQRSAITDSKEGILSIFSVFRYLNPDPNFRYEKDELKDSIVIIGISHFDAGDIHQTPLDEMPGMLVIANAIRSLLLNHGQIEPLGPEKIFAEMALLFLAALVFVGSVVLVNVIPSLVAGYWFAMLLVTGFGWFLLSLLSASLLKGGIWIDFSLPLVAIFFHHVVTKFHDLREEAKKAKKAAKQEVTEAKEEVKKVEKKWQTCQGELQTRQGELQACQKNLHQCEQDKQQILLDLAKGKLTEKRVIK